MSNKTINLTNDQYMTYMLQYLDTLMKGRNKPDNSKLGNGGHLRESVGEVDEIASIKLKLKTIFKLEDVNYHNKS